MPKGSTFWLTLISLVVVGPGILGIACYGPKTNSGFQSG